MYKCHQGLKLKDKINSEKFNMNNFSIKEKLILSNYIQIFKNKC